MPMKCIDQMPVPMATAPPTSQSCADDPFARATLAASRSAVWDTTMATSIESSTRL